MKALTIIFLTLVIFGGAGYFTWTLFFKPQAELREEALLPPPTPPPDYTIPEYERCLQAAESGQTLDARTLLTNFIERYPSSSKIEDARDRLGEINTSLFLSTVQMPGKELYVVKPGDVITKVALHFKSTPELIMRMNHLRSEKLRIGQRLVIGSGNFSLSISRRRQKVIVLEDGKFFKQYPILGFPPRARPSGDKKVGPTPRMPKIAGKITDKAAFSHGQRVIFADEKYQEAEHWIVIAPSGFSLYTESTAPPGEPPFPKPPGGGYGLAPGDMQELAALLRKNDPVTIE